MKKILIIVGLLMYMTTSVYALEACGPEFSTGVDNGETVDYNTSYNGYNDTDRSTDLTFNFELTWKFGWKKMCERQNAAEARKLDLEIRDALLEANATEIETLTDRIDFCLETEAKYKELSRDLPESVKDICDGLL